MPKKYVVLRHNMGITTRVTEPLDKAEAIEKVDTLNEDLPKHSLTKYSMKAVRNG